MRGVRFVAFILFQSIFLLGYARAGVVGLWSQQDTLTNWLVYADHSLVSNPADIHRLGDSLRHLGRSTNHLEWVLAAWDWELEAYLDRQQWEKAYEAQDSVIKWRDSLRAVDYLNVMKGDSVSLELLSQRNEIFDLKQTRALQALKVKRRQLMIYTLITAMVLLVLLLGLLIFRNRTSRRTFDILERRHEEFQERNHELKVQREKLQFSELKLTELNAAKDRFFTMVAKDMRSPLNTLSSFLSLMLQNAESFTREEMGDLAVRIDGSVKNLSHLIENLLHWSRQQMRTIDCRPSEFSLERLVNDQISYLQSVAQSKDLTIEVDVALSDEDVLVLADKSHMEFVIRNLLFNALKYSSKGKTIKVGIRKAGAMLEFYVQDEGIGMSEEVMQNLWSGNSIIVKVGTEQEKGTGLGLRLSKMFVEMNHGQLYVESEAQQGTNVSFTVPMAS